MKSVLLHTTMKDTEVSLRTEVRLCGGKDSRTKYGQNHDDGADVFSHSGNDTEYDIYRPNTS
jgi:hypothetical protein